MRLLFPAVILLALCGSASAQDFFQRPMMAKGQSGVGLGMICDTPEQTDRFLTLRNGGASEERAAATVNSEARDPRACGKALVAFRVEEELQKANLQHMDGKPVTVAKIMVLAISQDGENWSPIQPKVQYTVLPAKGKDV